LLCGQLLLQLLHSCCGSGQISKRLLALSLQLLLLLLCCLGNLLQLLLHRLNCF
jgi:hypothetical protein